MFTLIYSDSGETKRFPLPHGSTVVGRPPNCDLAIHHPTISRAHARFDVSETACTVTDLGSLNGTFRNKEAITTATVSDGDVLVLGGVGFRVEQSASDRLTLSEQHAILEDSGTIVRQVAASPPTAAVTATVAAVADPSRLLRLMSDVARTLAQSQPLPQVLTRVVDLAFDMIPAERAFLILVEGNGALVPRVVRRRGKGDAGTASISQTIVKRVLEERVAILAGDAQTDPRLKASESIMIQAVRSFMCVPLLHENAVTGLFYVDTPRSQKFSTPDLDMFTALANYTAVAIEQARLGTRLLEETRRRERLQRYHSPGVVGRILESGDDADAPFLAQERDLTVLFADIVGFTSIAEGLAPGQVAQLLNSYLGAMSDVIFEHEGTLDKFIGDAVMAVFGAPLDQPDHALRAVRTALQMRRALTALNADRETPIQMRISINSGVALVGDMGSPRRREYTVLGDVVNTASRMEKLACPGEIIVSDATCVRLGGAVAVRSKGKVNLRGRVHETEIFEILA